MPCKKIAISIVLAMFSGAALADWQLIGSNGNEFSLFADPDTKRRNADVVTIAEMVTYGEPQTAGGRHRYLSEKSQAEYDCSSQRMRVVVSEKYAGPRATGGLLQRETSGANRWMPIPRNTNMEKIFRLACNRA